MIITALSSYFTNIGLSQGDFLNFSSPRGKPSVRGSPASRLDGVSFLAVLSSLYLFFVSI
jgi:hypothetical protein